MNATVPAIHLGDDELKMIARINQELKEYEKNLERVRLREGICNILNVSRVGNQYMQAKKPWALVKGTDEEKIQGSTVIAICLNISYLLSVVVYPYMPNVSIAIRKQLNLPLFDVNSEKENYDSGNIKPEVYSYPKFYNTFVQFLKEGHRIGNAEPLFKRITDAEVKEWKEKFGGQKAAGAAEEPKEADKKSKRQLEKEKKEAKKAAAAAKAAADGGEATPASVAAPSDVSVDTQSN
jgi:methionyl-tRNA synthetase